MKLPKTTDNSPRIILLLLQNIIIIITSEAKEKAARIISAKYSIS